MPVKYTKVGPGTLKLGAIGSEVDFSFQVIECVLAADKDQEDNITVLSGDTIPGDIAYSWQMKGELVQDLSADGVNKFAFENAGEQVPFAFEPNSASGPSFSGTLIVDPLDIGGKAGTKPTAEFEFSIVGKPTWDTDVTP
ncbi:hypothetical protein AAFP35_08270 [Gordonia sp. CPCC 206044]|uniref:hypothetical protein n=1 Tax=Gordonia sp. CPCC 206044 TaxID=3140793 RepID=UPI003AF3F801